jgi:hypothetical protein
MHPKARRKVSATEDRSRDRNPPTKLDRMVMQLTRPEGASLAELATVTGWQAHSVRGALAGSLKKKGHLILSEKINGERRYRIGERG